MCLPFKNLLVCLPLSIILWCCSCTIVPSYIPRVNFFEEYPKLLGEFSSVSDIVAVVDARVQLLKFRMHGFEIDMVLATLNATEPPTDDELMDVTIFDRAGPESRISLNGIRTALVFQSMMKKADADVFSVVLKAVKTWAKGMWNLAVAQVRVPRCEGRGRRRCWCVTITLPCFVVAVCPPLHRCCSTANLRSQFRFHQFRRLCCARSFGRPRTTQGLRSGTIPTVFRDVRCPLQSCAFRHEQDARPDFARHELKSVSAVLSSMAGPPRHVGAGPQLPRPQRG